MKRLITTTMACLALSGCVSVGGFGAAHESARLFADRADYYAQREIPPDYHQAKTITVTVHICGRDTLRQAPCNAGTGNMCSSPGEIWILGGPDYVSQWGLGHEMGHQLGYNPDTFGEIRPRD